MIKRWYLLAVVLWINFGVLWVVVMEGAIAVDSTTLAASIEWPLLWAGVLTGLLAGLVFVGFEIVKTAAIEKISRRVNRGTT